MPTNGSNGHRPSPPRWRGFVYYLRCKLQHRPYLVNVEFTKLCNAKCFFCHCWQLESPDELQDYGPVIQRFRPVLCSVSGGEPMLRKNYPDLLKKMRPWCHYMMIITNGALLNEDSAEKLRWAGVDQITISLDYLSKKHDEVRKIDGLFEHISTVAPKLRSQGYKICFNSIIMESNLDEILPLARKALGWDCFISFSSFCTLKANEESEWVREERMKQLAEIVGELKEMKREYRHIKNSNYYLDHIVPYFKEGGVADCKAGHNFIQITPDGYVQRCSEMPRMAHYTKYWPTQVGETLCTKCWYGCRGETESNLIAPGRLKDLLRA
ncbi:MAG: radical SAM protein [Deltaproteobacteria bacterium]|nr:radical SAM protein [Deltaproteobacteria bacterium]MBI4223371.1 radical SAM protein [Deltaproteobacteria bacterium]